MFAEPTAVQNYLLQVVRIKKCTCVQGLSDLLVFTPKNHITFFYPQSCLFINTVRELLFLRKYVWEALFGNCYFLRSRQHTDFKAANLNLLTCEWCHHAETNKHSRRDWVISFETSQIGIFFILHFLCTVTSSLVMHGNMELTRKIS